MNSADKSPKTSADEGDQLRVRNFYRQRIENIALGDNSRHQGLGVGMDFAGLHQGLGVTAFYVSLKLVLGQDSARRIGLARCFSWRRSIKMLLGWILIRLKNARS